MFFVVIHPVLRPSIRYAWRTLAAAGLILVAAAVVCLERVDTTPWARHSWAVTAEETLDRARRDAPADIPVGELRAGFGRVRLAARPNATTNPEQPFLVGLPLAGYGSREGRPATGVHDDLWTRAVAFAEGGRTGVVVSADLLIIPRESAEAALARIQEGCGLSPDRVYFGATHSHSSLGGWAEGWVGEAFAGPFRPGLREWLGAKLAEAALEAISDLAPAAAGHATFQAPELIRNRLLGNAGRVDPEFSVLRVRQVDGDQAVLGSFSAHATVLPSSFMEFSGDYPGVWQRSVEEATGGLAVFLAGAVGSHGPRPPGRGWEGAQAMGQSLAQRTLTTCAGIHLTQRVAFDLVTVRFPLPELQARVTSGIRLRPWMARRVLPVHDTSWVQALRLDDAVWMSTPCDYSGELALDLKATARASGLTAVVTSFNGDYIGYVLPAEDYTLNNYETRTMSFFGPQMPGYLDHMLRGVLAAIAAPTDPAATNTLAPTAMTRH